MAQSHRRRVVLSLNRAYSHDPLECIDSIGGMNPDYTRWKFSQAAAIAAIEAGTDAFFVEEDGQTVELVVLVHGGQKYLRTKIAEKRPADLVKLAQS